MQNHAFKTNNFQYDSTEPARTPQQKSAHLYLASVNTDVTESSGQYGPDLGEFEAQYLLGYSCFA